MRISHKQQMNRFASQDLTSVLPIKQQLELIDRFFESPDNLSNPKDLTLVQKYVQNNDDAFAWFLRDRYHTSDGHPLAFLEPKHERYAPKLAAVYNAWLNFKQQPGKTAKQCLLHLLKTHARDYGLIDGEGKPLKSLNELAAVANWEPNGGAPKTPNRKHR
ncbi:hypothetical protein [Aeromonas veronii]|uniref:hypothetical protein n=1 Tax=Aeromonas TaxID=642 RepID=UPI0011A90946|nr:hypothetical protein [Aeromonas veronii]